MAPVSSTARLINTDGPPSQRHAIRNRVNALGRTGPEMAAGAHVLPPSADTSTRRTRPAPDHAIPEIWYRPGPCIFNPPDGDVMTDFTPIGNVNCRARPSGSESVYFDVSSFVITGASVTLRRRSHLTFVLPSQPGNSKRIGYPFSGRRRSPF